ncbi:hypothetical protein HYZ97_01575 [Candidatus Pacearchaeota archaeon]|nr:hypothetical protein [Candidatus Pacearchaeota archaeon]
MHTEQDFERDVETYQRWLDDIGKAKALRERSFIRSVIDLFNLTPSTPAHPIRGRADLSETQQTAVGHGVDYRVLERKFRDIAEGRRTGDISPEEARLMISLAHEGYEACKHTYIVNSVYAIHVQQDD